jgi:hypothetical protein
LADPVPEFVCECESAPCVGFVGVDAYPPLSRHEYARDGETRLLRDLEGAEILCDGVDRDRHVRAAEELSVSASEGGGADVGDGAGHVPLDPVIGCG